ncbi:MAG: hypothetical protein ABSG84_09555 [Acidobacteriaceae bacterium]|jgi:hypothetical protein
MVEHTRTHPRLTQTTPPGQRQKLSLGTLFVPEKLKGKRRINLLLFFHGGDWLPELAVAQQRNMAVITVQAGSGSSTYEKLFADPATFPKLLTEAQSAASVTFAEVDLAGWSAGCGALRQILRDPTAYDRVHRVLCIDGVHAGYISGAPGNDAAPGPAESQLDPANLQSWLHFGTDAIAGRKRLIITHSEILPGTYASTTETADYLLHQWGLTPHPVVRWGPMGTQMLSETKAGGLLVVGLAGNSAPDHVDQFHSLPEYLRWLSRK